MKKSILTLAIVVFGSVLAFAQNDNQKTKTEKKVYNGQGFQDFDIFVTGTASFQSINSQEISERRIFTLSPKIGYFLSSDFAVGLDLGFNSNKLEESNVANITTENVVRQFGIGGFGRYYFLPRNKFSLFGQASVNYLSAKNETTTGTTDPVTNTITYTESELKSNGFGVGLSAGANYFLNSHFALETFVGFLNYNTAKVDLPGAKSDDSFSLGIDLSSVSFGVLYRF